MKLIKNSTILSTQARFKEISLEKPSTRNKEKLSYENATRIAQKKKFHHKKKVRVIYWKR